MLSSHLTNASTVITSIKLLKALGFIYYQSRQIYILTKTGNIFRVLYKLGKNGNNS